MKKTKLITLFTLVVVALSITLSCVTVSAASYPTIFPKNYSMVVTKGETANLEFTIFNEFNNEKYHINVYKGSSLDIDEGTAELVASAENSAISTNGMLDLTITWDTTDVECGLYTVEYYMSFYTLYSWHETPTRGSLMTIKIVEPTQPQDQISVMVNNQKITFDQPPIVENGRTLVPLRAIFEALGATVDWDNNTNTVTSKRGNTEIKVTTGWGKMFVNGQEKSLDVPAKLVNNRTMVPARAVAEAFGCNVDWDDATQTVIITN